MTNGRRGALFRHHEPASWRHTGEALPRAPALSDRSTPFDIAATTAVLDCLTIGVMVLNGDGSILAQNHAIRSICAADDGIGFSGTGLTFDDTDASRLYSAAMAIRRTRGAGVDPAWIKVSRPSGRWPYVVTLGSFAAPPALPAEGCVMISITDPESVKGVKPETLSSLFALTPSEARLTAALMRYGSLSAAAPVCGITLGSARQYMKRILAKTGAGSQIQLVAQLAAYVM